MSSISSTLSSVAYNYALVPATSLLVAEGVRQIGKMIPGADHAIPDHNMPLVLQMTEAEYNAARPLAYAITSAMFTASAVTTAAMTDSLPGCATSIGLGALYAFAINRNPDMTLWNLAFHI